MPDDSTPGHFPSTEWTLVLAAGSDATRAMPALESLLGGFVHHLTNLYRHDRAARRGGGVVPISLEDAEAVLPADGSLTPDEAFDRRWAELVLTNAVDRLREQHERTGKAVLWRVLGPVITGRAATGYDSLAATLGITPQAVGVQVHRLRRRLRTLVRSEVARTVLTADDLETEYSYLIGLFKR